MKRVLLIIFVLLFADFVTLAAYQLVAFDREFTSEQQDVIDYVRGGELEGEFTALEVSHLVDVRNVMRNVSIYFWSLLVALVLIGWYLNTQKGLGRGLMYGGGFSVLVVVGFSLFAILNFDLLFEWFHRLFFEEGTYIFGVDSLIIQLFPLRFFIDVFSEIVLVSLALGILFILVGYSLKHESGGKRR